jgi:CHAT domain-containing protein
LVENFNISYAPSVSVLYNLLIRKMKKIPRKNILGFANPVYLIPGKSKMGSPPDQDEVLRKYYLEKGFNLSPLLYSEIEIRNISKYFKKKFRDFYLRDDAKEENLKQLPLSNYSIIHFATHGLLNETIVSRTALVLTLDNDPAEDGFVQVREIYDIKLNAELVVLSACQSGKGKIHKGEGVSGLTRAFLYAGAKSVVASLWNINDKSTSQFMTYFYEFISQGMAKIEALQRAKIKMIKSDYSHPFYWAAFILSGEYNSPIKIPKPSWWDSLF